MKELFFTNTWIADADMISTHIDEAKKILDRNTCNIQQEAKNSLESIAENFQGTTKDDILRYKEIGTSLQHWLVVKLNQFEAKLKLYENNNNKLVEMIFEDFSDAKYLFNSTNLGVFKKLKEKYREKFSDFLIKQDQILHTKKLLEEAKNIIVQCAKENLDAMDALKNKGASLSNNALKPVINRLSQIKTFLHSWAHSKLISFRKQLANCTDEITALEIAQKQFSDLADLIKSTDIPKFKSLFESIHRQCYEEFARFLAAQYKTFLKTVSSANTIEDLEALKRKIDLFCQAVNTDLKELNNPSFDFNSLYYKAHDKSLTLELTQEQEITQANLLPKLRLLMCNLFRDKDDVIILEQEQNQDTQRIDYYFQFPSRHFPEEISSLFEKDETLNQQGIYKLNMATNLTPQQAEEIYTTFEEKISSYIVEKEKPFDFNQFTFFAHGQSIQKSYQYPENGKGLRYPVTIHRTEFGNDFSNFLI